MDVSRAQLSNLGDAIALDDPSFPWRVRVTVSRTSDKPQVTSLTVESRDGVPVTSTTLGKIPVRQIAGVAASAVLGQGDEAQYRMLAQPRPDGARSWPDDHYGRVHRVASWARRIGRDGGETAAVAEFWGVCSRTARRWIARSPGEPLPSSRTRREPVRVRLP